MTNTERIRIQKEIGKSYLGPMFNKEKEDEAKAEVANLRLQAIASLPKLAIFSDEAHHTYGQAMDKELKKSARRWIIFIIRIPKPKPAQPMRPNWFAW